MRISQKAIDDAMRRAESVIVAMKKTGFLPVIVLSHQAMSARAFDLMRFILEESDIEEIDSMRCEVQVAAMSIIERIEAANLMLPASHRHCA